MVFARRISILFVTLLLAGLGGATLLRLAPGFGVDERDLDSRLNAVSHEAVEAVGAGEGNVGRFYLLYLSRLAQGDLGTSRLFSRPVVELLRERLPLTMGTVLGGFAMAWAAGLALSAVSAMARNQALPFALAGFGSALLCVPSALMAVMFYRMDVPASAGVAAVIFPKVFFYSKRLFRASLAKPHVLTARAKGLGDVRVFAWHAVPPVAGELFALVGVTLALGLSAAIPLEVILDLPGIGQLAWKAALGRDLSLLVSLTLLIGAFTLAANAFADALAHAAPGAGLNDNSR